MTVEADGVFYRDVISITQVAANKAVLAMPGKTVEVPIFSPIRIIGGITEAAVSAGPFKEEEKAASPPGAAWKAFVSKIAAKLFPVSASKKA